MRPRPEVLDRLTQPVALAAEGRRAAQDGAVADHVRGQQEPRARPLQERGDGGRQGRPVAGLRCARCMASSASPSWKRSRWRAPCSRAASQGPSARSQASRLYSSAGASTLQIMWPGRQLQPSTVRTVTPAAPPGLAQRRAAPDEPAVADEALHRVLAQYARGGGGGRGQHRLRPGYGLVVGAGERTLLALLDVQVVGGDGGRVLARELRVRRRLGGAGRPVVEVHELQVRDALDPAPEAQPLSAHALQRIEPPDVRRGVEERRRHSEPPQLAGRVHGPLDPGAVAEGRHHHAAPHRQGRPASAATQLSSATRGKAGSVMGLRPAHCRRALHGALRPVERLHHASTIVLRTMGSLAAIRRSL